MNWKPGVPDARYSLMYVLLCQLDSRLGSSSRIRSLSTSGFCMPPTILITSKVVWPPPAISWLTTADGALPIETRLTWSPVGCSNRDQFPPGSPTPTSAMASVRPAARAGGASLPPAISPAPRAAPACSTCRRKRGGTLQFLFMTVSLMFGPPGQRLVQAGRRAAEAMMTVGRDVVPAPNDPAAAARTVQQNRCQAPADEPASMSRADATGQIR